ncbi:hypothetical protein AH07_28 [Pantoea phage AH07]|nr:hypothetical protein AH07_28 [Pantoea phage AH07]
MFAEVLKLFRRFASYRKTSVFYKLCILICFAWFPSLHLEHRFVHLPMSTH